MTIANCMPDRKVLMGGVAGVIAWGVQAGLQELAGIEIPAIYQPLVPLAVAKIIGYVTVPRARDIIKRIDDDLAQAAGYMPDPSPQAAAIRALPAAPTKAG